MITNEQVNTVLLTLEKEITAISNRFASKYRSDIQQEIRIKIWRYLTETYKNESFTLDDLLEYVRNNLDFIGLMASKVIIRQYVKDSKRYVDIDGMDFAICDNQSLVDFALDCKKYEKILSKKEMLIIEYLFGGNDNFTNFDNISRQLGLTGKGASRYTLNIIAKKILNYRPKSP